MVEVGMVRWNDETDGQWKKLAEEVMTGMKEWRMAHPKATFQEIEKALDEQLARIRARMLEDIALASRATEISNRAEQERLHCPQCGHILQAGGKATRTLTTSHNQTVSLERDYARCPACGAGLFPPG